MMDKTFLEQLYYGNVAPYDKNIRRGSKVDKITKIAESRCDVFRDKLPQELKREFDNIISLEISQACEMELEAFIYGCRFIFRILAACCGDENKDFQFEELLKLEDEVK